MQTDALRHSGAILGGIFVLLIASHARADDLSALSSLHLSSSHLDSQEPHLSHILNHAPTPPRGAPQDLEGRLKHQLRLTQRTIEDFLNLKTLYQKQTAHVPLYGDEVILVDQDNISYNLLRPFHKETSKPGDEHVLFGPCVYQWQSAAQINYGFQLLVPW